QPLISEARMLTRSSRLSSSPLSLIIWPSSKSLRVSCGDCFVELSLWLMEFPPFAQMTFGSGRTGQVFRGSWTGDWTPAWQPVLQCLIRLHIVHHAGEPIFGPRHHLGAGQGAGGGEGQGA